MPAAPAARVCFPVSTDVPSDTPASSRLIHLQFVDGVAEDIANNFCEGFRRGVHQSRQSPDTSFRCHNGLPIQGIPAVLRAVRDFFTRITPEPGGGPLRNVWYWPRQYLRTAGRLGSAKPGECRAVTRRADTASLSRTGLVNPVGASCTSSEGSIRCSSVRILRVCDNRDARRGERTVKRLGTLFLQGLMAILPIAVTVYLVYWLAASAEAVLGRAMRFVIGDLYYVPGSGVLAGILITLGIGLLLRIWLFRKVFSLGETLLQRIPGIKSLYGSIRDMVGFFDASKQKEFDKTVMVALAEGNVRLMGLVTREDFRDLPAGIGDEQTVAVYLPMSYQLGGFTVMVPKDKIRPVDMKVDQAMQFVLTAAVSPKTEGKKRPGP